MVTDASIGNLLFGKTRQGILGLLFTHPGEAYHLRLIVRLTGAGLGPAQRELEKLTATGLIRREQRGRQVSYQVERRSPVYEELRGLVVAGGGFWAVGRARYGFGGRSAAAGLSSPAAIGARSRRRHGRR